MRARLAAASLAFAALVPAAASGAALSGSVAFSGVDPRPAVATGLTTDVTIGQDVSDPGASQLRRLQITLPQGLGLGPQMSTGGSELHLCTPGQFAVHAAVASSCSDQTRIGVATITAPSITGTLTGGIYLGAAPTPGALPAIFVEAAADASTAPDAARLKLAGTLAVDGDGRLGLLFDEIPSPPIAELRLALSGGDRSILGTPSGCGTAAGFATLTSALTSATVAVAGPVTIDQDCALPGFAPSIGLAAGDARAGAAASTAIGVSRDDRSPRLGAVRFSLPSGLLATIGAVPECGATGDAAAGCPPETRIGSVQLSAGLGAAPRTWGGELYLTPRSPGAVAGAHAVVHVQIGDLALGDLVIPVRIDLRPTDSGLDLSFTVPTSFRGLALQTRGVSFNLDRAGFTLNPSACGPLGFSATLTSDAGETVGRSGAVGYQGCGGLPFVPTLSAALTGDLAPGGHPNVSVAVNARAGDATLAGAAVTLPRAVGVDLANLTNVCPRATFDAVACSADQRVGTATARIALTPEPIPGDVYLVRIPGETLPGLGLSFTGRYSQRVLSTVRVNSAGRLVTRFDGIPDLPLQRLDMDITGGARGPIQIAKTACLDGAVWDASFVAQGGQASSHTIPAPCPPRDAKKSAITLSRFDGLTWRIPDLGGRALQAAKLTLPAGFVFVRQRAKLRKYQQISVGGGKGRLAVSTRAVILTPASVAAKSITVRLKAGSLRRTTKTAKGDPLRRLKIKVRLGFRDGTVQTQAITIRGR